jgi:DNA repair exonuclease SbcCD ATPase subunit
MEFKGFLSKQGLTDEQVATITKAMQDEKIFTTQEENIEARFEKMRAQRDSKQEELDAANKLVEDLQAATKENEDAQKQIDTYKQEAEKLQGQLATLEKTGVVKAALEKVGVTDVDYAIYKLGGVDSLELKDGAITDLDNKVKELKEAIPTYFQTDDGAKQPEDKGKGYKPLDNGLKGDNNPDGEELSIADKIAANLEAAKD